MLSHRVSNDTRRMRDRFIEVCVAAISDLNHEAPRRDAYLQGLAICRGLDTLEDLDIVLEMRRGGCKGLRRRTGRDDYPRYLWTTEAIGWVTGYLSQLQISVRDNRGSMPRPDVAGTPAGFKAVAWLLVATITGIGGAALASALFG
jgi:hypothetical protein